MTNNKALLKLIKCVLPKEIVDSFELVSLNKSGETLDIYRRIEYHS
ncbi:MAG: hypothetical protein LBL13_02710 [Bacteroidales bacterium]|jgi:hypothetical protein|nr:hypothetical protein [Bacteroidales bacterium]